MKELKIYQRKLINLDKQETKPDCIFCKENKLVKNTVYKGKVWVLTKLGDTSDVKGFKLYKCHRCNTLFIR